MDSDALVILALRALSCSQKHLAAQLGVSPTQISKWKKGEHISREMEDKLRALSGIGTLDASLVLAAGSVKAAEQWERLIRTLADMAIDSEESGYMTYPLLDDLGLLCSETLSVLQQMGVVIPKEFPKDLANFGDGDDDLEMDASPFTQLIYEMFKALTNVYGFYAAYIQDLMHDDALDLFNTPAENIEPCLLALAASKIEVPTELATNFNTFKRKIERDYTQWLETVKLAAFRAGSPLKAELHHLVVNPHDSLGHEAEAESFGFNGSRLHPDIYMNELLVGMRVIHQVLPVIMKKLGIEDEFSLDLSDLRLH